MKAQPKTLNPRHQYILPIDSQAADAIKAAKNVKSWGTWATKRFLEKRGIPLDLYLLARRLLMCNSVFLRKQAY